MHSAQLVTSQPIQLQVNEEGFYFIKIFGLDGYTVLPEKAHQSHNTS